MAELPAILSKDLEPRTKASIPIHALILLLYGMVLTLPAIRPGFVFGDDTLAHLVWSRHFVDQRHGQTKYLLKKAMEPLLPRQILYRAKQGFAVPVAKWFRDGTLLPGGAEAVDGLAPGFVARMLAEHRAGRANQHAFLWNYWVLQAAARRPR
jgi:asparagine synthetase B (glutamine-hydrolysing)